MASPGDVVITQHERHDRVEIRKRHGSIFFELCYLPLADYLAIRMMISSFPRVSITPVLVPSRCMITPALFSNHKSLLPDGLKLALLCVYLPGKSATLASL